MELVERTSVLEEMHRCFGRAAEGNGHAVFLTGEAGVGKTSVVNKFAGDVRKSARVFTGACDSLFTPRPLGPLYDLAAQMDDGLLEQLVRQDGRADIFTSFLRKIDGQPKPVVLIFEDIHWADEATIDLIKFLARRVGRHRCLMVLTSRDEQQAAVAIRKLFAELPPDDFSRISVNSLSRDAVSQLAAHANHKDADRIYALTGGNPFYISEILANYSPGIPERVKDSILSVFYAQTADTRSLLELLSILPSRIPLSLADDVENEFPGGLEHCIGSGVITDRGEHLAFKHELYRLTIEESLPSHRLRTLHRKVLAWLRLRKAADDATLLHHAKLAHDRGVILELAPKAAEDASALGAHLQAAEFYQLAIDNGDSKDPSLADVLERHAYECYLTNQIPRAISSQQLALGLRKQGNDRIKEGDAMRFLSRVYWYSGDRLNALAYGTDAIALLENGPPTRERAQAYNNMSQLHMLSGNRSETLKWGNKAIDLAGVLNDPEILCSALNNAGTVLAWYADTAAEGIPKILNSLEIALQNNFQEHAARAYTNLTAAYVTNAEYSKALPVFETALQYCDARDLSSWFFYMQSEKIKLLMAIGNWPAAEEISASLYQDSFQPLMVRVNAIGVLAKLQLRKGEFDKAMSLIAEGKNLAMSTREAQRIVPILTAELELSWIRQDSLVSADVEWAAENIFPDKDSSWHYSALAYWMKRVGIPPDLNIKYAGPYRDDMTKNAAAAAAAWKISGSRYEEALALFSGDGDQQKLALSMLDELGATATAGMIRSVLRKNGITNIPRGMRESTRKNPANLTTRQIDVLRLLREGLQNKEIADKLFISPKTVDHHISAILSQLEVNTRAKAVHEAVRLGILESL